MHGLTFSALATIPGSRPGAELIIKNQTIMMLQNEESEIKLTELLQSDITERKKEENILSGIHRDYDRW